MAEQKILGRFVHCKAEEILNIWNIFEFALVNCNIIVTYFRDVYTCIFNLCKESFICRNKLKNVYMNLVVAAVHLGIFPANYFVCHRDFLKNSLGKCTGS